MSLLQVSALSLCQCCHCLHYQYVNSLVVCIASMPIFSLSALSVCQFSYCLCCQYVSSLIDCIASMSVLSLSALPLPVCQFSHWLLWPYACSIIFCICLFYHFLHCQYVCFYHFLHCQHVSSFTDCIASIFSQFQNTFLEYMYCNHFHYLLTTLLLTFVIVPIIKRQNYKLILDNLKYCCLLPKSDLPWIVSGRMERAVWSSTQIPAILLSCGRLRWANRFKKTGSCMSRRRRAERYVLANWNVIL